LPCLPDFDAITGTIMRSQAEIISLLTNPGIIAVVRTEKTEQVLPVCEALLAGGVMAVEITMTVPNALEAIRLAGQRHGTRALIGVGTVLNAAAARAAIDAGAEYVVSPITKLELIDVAHAAGKPVMIGAYTPTEAQLAHEAGADFVKIFPADKLGPGYIKNIRAPLPHLRVVPTGGVDLNTAADFLKAGCAALGVGSSLVSAEILRTGNWAELTRLAGEFVRIVREFRTPKM
jgi:2-dehydro-3-deoxyphosphogluconate aldolase/(4S)-4-hydroxy-2-oxoglutarate aldolase